MLRSWMVSSTVLQYTSWMLWCNTPVFWFPLLSWVNNSKFPADSVKSHTQRRTVQNTKNVNAIYLRHLNGNHWELCFSDIMTYVSVVFPSIFQSKVIGNFSFIINVYPFRGDLSVLSLISIRIFLFLPHQLMMCSKFETRLKDFDTLVIFIGFLSSNNSSNTSRYEVW
jgi:hypothetical protein